MYTVHTLTMRKFKPTTLDSPRAPHWTVTLKTRRKAEALEAAGQHPTRATVSDHAYQVIFDNERPPALVYDVEMR